MKFASLSLFLAVVVAFPEVEWSNHMFPRQESSALSAPGTSGLGKTCKIVPSDSNWPSPARWGALKQAVEGNLIKTVPPAAVCHNSFDGIPTFDEAACAAVRAEWGEQKFHVEHPSGVSLMWDAWSNQTCNPFTDSSAPCTIGTFPLYVVRAKNVAHVQSAVNMAREQNIRLVIRNTGHDFSGKSTGAGSLSLWMHDFKSIEFIQRYNKQNEPYRGTAVKIGAGVQVKELYDALHKKNQVTVAGECAGVGFAGGYVQGGGHGPLSPLYGMASDNVLEFEVVTADGKLKTANRNENCDLFKALRGGGPSSYGVVTSVTVKTFPELRTSGALAFIGNDVDDEIFWKASEIFHKLGADWVAQDIYVYYELGVKGRALEIAPILAPGKSKQELDAILEPLWTKWDEIGVQYTKSTQEFASFFDAYNTLFSTEPVGIAFYTTGRLISRDSLRTNTTAINNIFRELVTLGRFFIGHILSPGNHGVDTRNTAINPAWKEHATLPLWNTILTRSETSEQIQLVINEVNLYHKKLKDVTPGGGSYLNEANIFEPDWQQQMYGRTWDELVRIKEHYDPMGVFYADTAVGSQNWKKVGEWDRLCPV